MNRILALALAGLLALLPVEALAAISVVQSAAGTQAYPGGVNCPVGGGSGGNTCVAGGSSTTYNFAAGDTIIGPCANYIGAGGANLTTAFDGTNSYSAAIGNTSFTGTMVVAGLWYSSNISAVSAGNYTCNSTGGGSNVIGGVFLDVSGLNASGALDTAVTNTANPTSTANPSVTSAGPSTSFNEIFVGCVIEDNLANTLVSEASGWTSLPDTFSVSGGTAIHCAYIIVSTKGSQTYNPIFLTSTTWAAMIVSFSAPGGAAIAPSLLLMGVGP